MKIDTTAHIRITPLTDCGCRPAAEPTLHTDVPIYLTGEPQIADDALTAYTIELRMHDLAVPELTAHAMVETYVNTNRHIALDNGAPAQWASITLRHLVDGKRAEPWSRCADHGGTTGDTGPAIIITGTWSSGPHDLPGWN